MCHGLIGRPPTTQKATWNSTHRILQIESQGSYLFILLGSRRSRIRTEPPRGNSAEEVGRLVGPNGEAYSPTLQRPASGRVGHASESPHRGRRALAGRRPSRRGRRAGSDGRHAGASFVGDRAPAVRSRRPSTVGRARHGRTPDAGAGAVASIRERKNGVAHRGEAGREVGERDGRGR
jgi:hypothetical protein